MMKPMLIVVLAGMVVMAGAHASELTIEQQLTPEERRATGLDTLSPRQLELLNRLLRERRDAAADATPATAVIASDAPPPVKLGEPLPAASPAPAAAQTEAPQDGARQFIGLDDHTIKTRVRGTVTGWEPGTEFRLQNGQTWKVLKGRASLRAPLQDPAIQVIPGLAGRWFLQVMEDLPKARVYRVD